MNWLQISVYESALMDLADGSGNADSELEESRYLHRLAEVLVQRLTARIFENQHRTAISIEIVAQFKLGDRE
jgi:hypothetical protein